MNCVARILDRNDDYAHFVNPAPAAIIDCRPFASLSLTTLRNLRVSSRRCGNEAALYRRSERAPVALSKPEAASSRLVDSGTRRRLPYWPRTVTHLVQRASKEELEMEMMMTKQDCGQEEEATEGERERRVRRLRQTDRRDGRFRGQRSSGRPACCSETIKVMYDRLMDPMLKGSRLNCDVVVVFSASICPPVHSSYQSCPASVGLLSSR